jgi:nitroreductase
MICGFSVTLRISLMNDRGVFPMRDANGYVIGVTESCPFFGRMYVPYNAIVYYLEEMVERSIGPHCPVREHPGDLKPEVPAAHLPGYAGVRAFSYCHPMVSTGEKTLFAIGSMQTSIRDCVQNSRSVRRFHEYTRISRETILELIDIARFCPSARNRQPLRYVVSCEPEETGKIRDCLLWALDLPGWGGPVAGERPAAYITVVTEKGCVPDPRYDAGIAAQTIMLAAAGKGLGGCIVGSIHRDLLSGVLSLPEQYEIHLVLALGYPAESILLEPLPPDGDTRYWRDEQGVHHVPKRSLEEILLSADGRYAIQKGKADETVRRYRDTLQRK